MNALRRPLAALHVRSTPTRWRAAHRLASALTLALSMLAAWPAQSAGLGEAQTASRIGEFLQVDIPLHGTDGTALEAECFRLGPRGSDDSLPWLTRANLTVSGKRLIVRSVQPVREPIIVLAVQIECGARLRREYTLLLGAPIAETAPAIELPASPASAPEREAPRPVSAPAAASAPPLPANQWLTAEGESPRSLARALYPRNSRGQRQFIQALRNANPDSVGKRSADTPLPTGTVLTIPDAEVVRSTALPAAPAAQPRRNEPRQTDSARATPAPRERGNNDRLLVSSSDERGLRLSTLIESRRELPEAERERLRNEVRLLAELDDKIATQLELSEKLRQLEAMQAGLRAKAEQLEAELRAQQNGLPPPITPSAAQPAAVTQATAGRFDQLLWVLAGLSVLGALGWALWRNRRRESAEETPLPASTELGPATLQGEPPLDIDSLIEPLTEQDIWPDRPDGRSPPMPSGPHSVQVVDGAVGPFSQPSAGPPSLLNIDAEAEEHDSAVELAEIMMSFGRVHGAAQTLADFIRANPKQAVKPWIKLLEVYRAANMRTEFDALTAQLNKTFNVKPVLWDDFEGALQAPESIENMPHIMAAVSERWGRRECQAYLHGLLRDNRQGTRQGFPLAIIDEILLLLAILESQLGPWRPDQAGEANPAPAAPEQIAPPLDLEEPPTQLSAFSGSAIDFELESADFTRTLHINLDELDDQTQHKQPDEK